VKTPIRYHVIRLYEKPLWGLKTRHYGSDG
jgi:hypothetical protein